MSVAEVWRLYLGHSFNLEATHLTIREPTYSLENAFSSSSTSKASKDELESMGLSPMK